jgi:hypothetical protein
MIASFIAGFVSAAVVALATIALHFVDRKSKKAEAMAITFTALAASGDALEPRAAYRMREIIELTRLR